MMGADVTTFNYSSTVIETAMTIGQRFGLKNHFHCVSVYDLTSRDLGTTLTTAVRQSICHGYYQLNPLIRRRFTRKETVYVPEEYAPL